jgi:hypothetical protein
VARSSHFLTSFKSMIAMKKLTLKLNSLNWSKLQLEPASEVTVRCVGSVLDTFAQYFFGQLYDEHPPLRPQERRGVPL